MLALLGFIPPREYVGGWFWGWEIGDGDFEAVLGGVGRGEWWCIVWRGKEEEGEGGVQHIIAL